MPSSAPSAPDLARAAQAELRHPRERPVLLLTLALVGLLVLFLTPFTLGGVALVLAVGLGLQILVTTFRMKAIRKRAVPIEQYPSLKVVFEQCRQRLGCRRPAEVLVVESPQRNAFAVGFREPYTVVLFTGLLDQLEPAEIAFVVGHELGHVELGHTLIHSLQSAVGARSFGVFGFGFLLQLVFLLWSRVAEHSADRAGLLACLDLRAGARALLVVSMDPKEARAMDLEAEIRRWTERDASLSERASAFLSTHPAISTRLDRMVDWMSTRPLKELAP